MTLVFKGYTLGSCYYFVQNLQKKICNETLFLLQILKEGPNYPEALIGRGTAYAFQRELDAAIADFSKVSF